MDPKLHMYFEKIHETMFNRHPLVNACVDGNVELVASFLAVKDPKEEYGRAFLLAFHEASWNENIHIIRQFIPVADHDDINHVFSHAAQHGNINIVELLLPFADPTFDKSYALIQSAFNNHVDIVKMLIPVSNPKDNQSCVLYAAVTNDNKELIEMLVPLCDCETVKQILLEQKKDITSLEYFIEKYERLQQKERLTDAIEHIGEPHCSVKRKI